MFPSRVTLLAALAVFIALAPTETLAQAIVEDFASDPTLPRSGAPLWQVRGPGAAQFQHEPGSSRRFTTDTAGSLAVTYDSLEPTSRYFTTFPSVFTQDDDFVFGAALTIRWEAYAPDPYGFHPIAFSLFNSVTTGDDRTGDLSDSRADTYDTLDMGYFPNVSPFFGGPFFSPSLFGEQVNPDAFANFAFGSIELGLRRGVTYLIEVEHSAATRTLTARISIVGSDGFADPLRDRTVVTDLSGITGFAVDALAISAYQDGYNVFASSGRSLLATVDYDLIYSGPKVDGRLPDELLRALRRFQRPGRDNHLRWVDGDLNEPGL